VAATASLEPADWAAVLEVNIMGMVHVAQALTGGMSARPRRDDGLHRVGRRADRKAVWREVLGEPLGEVDIGGFAGAVGRVRLGATWPRSSRSIRPW